MDEAIEYIEDDDALDDDALDVSFDNDSPLPSGGFGVEIQEKGKRKKANFMLQRLHDWLIKNGHKHEAEYLANMNKQMR